MTRRQTLHKCALFGQRIDRRSNVCMSFPYHSQCEWTKTVPNWEKRKIDVESAQCVQDVYKWKNCTRTCSQMKSNHFNWPWWSMWGTCLDTQPASLVSLGTWQRSVWHVFETVFFIFLSGVQKLPSVDMARCDMTSDQSKNYSAKAFIVFILFFSSIRASFSFDSHFLCLPAVAFLPIDFVTNSCIHMIFE